MSQTVKPTPVAPRPVAASSVPSVPFRSNEAAPEIKGGAPGINYLMNVKEHLVAFLGIGTRFRCAVTCKAWRFMSPGPRRVVSIHCTADAEKFVASTSGNECIFLHLGGYWQQPAPYSKRHAIPREMMQAWETSDAERKRRMHLTDATLIALLGVRAHHRVVGLQIGKGNKTISIECLTDFWAHLCTTVSWLGVADQNQAELTLLSHVLKKRPFKGRFLDVSGSGNCWWFIAQVLNDNLELQGLSISWPRINDPYYSGPSYPAVATLAGTAPLPYLTRLDVRVESNESRTPTNYELLAAWLLPRVPNLEVLPQVTMPYSGNLPGRKQGECEIQFTTALSKHCQRLKSIWVNQSGNEECFRLLLQIPTLEIILWRSYNNADVTGESVGAIRNLCMKHLHLGSMGKTAKQGLFNIVRSCPNLESFSIAYVKGITAEDAQAALALLPHIKYGRISFDGAPLAAIGELKMLPENIRAGCN